MCKEISEEVLKKLSFERLKLTALTEVLLNEYGKTVVDIVTEELNESVDFEPKFTAFIEKMTNELDTQRPSLLEGQYIIVQGNEYDYVIYKLPEGVDEDYVDVLACADDDAFNIVEYQSSNPDVDEHGEETEDRTLVTIKVPSQFKASRGEETISDGIVRVAFAK